MDDSIILLSTMSPKIKVKLKAGEKKFRRVRGASILALKKNIRRSSIHDKYIATESNQDINMVESYSTESYESSQHNGFRLAKLDRIEDKDEEAIEISDSSTDSSSVEESKTKPEVLLPKDKLNAISNWVAKVNIKNETCCSEYSELSTICNSVNGNDFLANNKGTAVNSTFDHGCNKKFNELFVKNNKQKVDETVSTNADDIVNGSFQQLTIVDSFEIMNRSLKSHKEATKDIENGNGVKISDVQIEKDFVLVNNDSEVQKETDRSNVEVTGALKVLDELYGNSWRANKESILSKTEPRRNIKLPSFKNISSERKPKQSLLYKNPYLESEKSKSQIILNSTHKSRLKETAQSPWLEKLKVLCDPDTDPESSPRKVTPTKLKFDDESSEDEISKISSRYFKNKTKNNSNKENDDDQFNNRHQNVTKRKPATKKVDFYENMLVARRSYSDSSDEEEPPLQTPKQHVKKQQYWISDSSTDSNSKSDKYSNSKTERKGKGFSTCSNDVHIRTKTVDKKTPKKIPRSAKEIDISSSDEEWDAEVSKIERKVEEKHGSYSFLASLSESVPISKCDMSARIFRNNFKKFKDELVKKLFRLYNDKVFDNILPEDMPIEWNDRMRSSAGFCYCKKVTRSNGNIERSARIALSPKVLDRADRLRDTLIHEMCHAVTWISNCVSDGHGDYWKSWALKAMKTFPELPNIKRCHNYVISTKYTYRCTSCGYSIGRHSKSLDIERKRCGYCLGKFEVLINKTNKKGETKAVAATSKKEPTGFALFVKENYSVYKTPQRKHADVMKVLGQKFQALKVDLK